MAKHPKTDKNNERDESGPVVITSVIMDRPAPEPPKKKEAPVLTLRTNLIERPAGKKKKPHTEKPAVEFKVKLMQPRRKPSAGPPGIGSMYPQGKG